jgi:hypothetical protein
MTDDGSPSVIRHPSSVAAVIESWASLPGGGQQKAKELAGVTGVSPSVFRPRRLCLYPRPISLAGAALLAALLHAAAGAAGPPAGRAAPAAAEFETRVAPLLARSCIECHSGSNPQGGLDLTTAEGARKGGKRGPAIVPGKPEASWLWKRVEAGQMPPGKPLPPAERALLKRWIAGGAAWGTGGVDPFRYTSDRRAGYDWWSLQPVRPASLPPVTAKGWAAQPIDRFVLARLEAAGLRPSPPADRLTLVRRLYFDLLGLPPSPEEIDEFLNDRRPGAYERLVDRLLASPHYGERWARHWLDVVRFGETQGFERNKFRPNAWKYRDWVVEALNSDMPYDEFVRLQLAGDLLRPDDPMAVLASGFLVVGPYDLTAYTATSTMMQAAARQEELEGLVGTVTQTFLGLTGNCARCHDHKFDPISQKEYYALAAAVGGTYHGAEREILTASGRAEAARLRETLAGQIAALKARAGGLSSGCEKRRLAEEVGRLESRDRLLAGGPAHVTQPKDPGVFRILARGDFKQPRDPVAPGGLAALAGVRAEWGLKQDAPEADRRKALAAWITDPANPLTYRVIVNRVWANHFGAGLVPTPSDLGFNGGRPSHPELLDYLASTFSRTRSLKSLHRLILLSNSYRQASRPSTAGLKVDAENRLFWRQNPRRLDAEALRDAVLAVSGELDPAIGGPGFRDWTVKTEGENDIYTVTDAVGPPYNRRTLYRTVVRAGTSPFLDVLDCPDPSVSAARRTATTTPLQALALLNNRFMEHAAAKWAERLEREAPGALRTQVEAAYRAAYGRMPSEEELRFGERFARARGAAQLCMVLLNSNEFVYVD